MKTSSMSPPQSIHTIPKTRRAFLEELGLTTVTATAMLSTLTMSCQDEQQSKGLVNADQSIHPTADQSTDQSNEPTACPPVPQHPIADLNTSDPELPMRQHDPRWGNELMWDRALVIKGLTELNGENEEDAQLMIREYEDGNNLANEGCQISALAMALRLFQPNADPPWTPSYLNELAQYFYYYTPAGISLVPIYADLVSDVSGGLVQLALKEEYLSGEPGWPKYYTNTSPLVRAYRSLAVNQRSSYLLMLKTGTWDDTIASHYVLLDPSDDGGVNDQNPLILDPAMPLDKSRPWRLSDSAQAILEDPGIAAEWQQKGIEATQICGVWVLVRWQEQPRQAILAPLVSAWARELSQDGSL